jgi:hypothetical protein
MLKWLTIFDWITPALANWHNVKRLPDDLRHVARGEPLSEHSIFVKDADYADAKAALGGLATGPDLYGGLFSDEWTMTVATDDLGEIESLLSWVGVDYRT